MRSKRYLISIFALISLSLVLSVSVFSTSQAESPSPYALETDVIMEMYELFPDGSSKGILCFAGNVNWGCTVFCVNEDVCAPEPAKPYPYDTSQPSVPIETDYLLDVVTQEMSPEVYEEAVALASQAIASRSFTHYYINNLPSTPFNNSTQYQAFIPFRFEKLNPSTMPDNLDNPCASSNLNLYQRQVCTATADKHYLASNVPVGNEYAAKTLFIADVFEETDDATFDKPYLAGVSDPISVACDAKDEGVNSYGMSQNGANRWARGHQCSYSDAEPEEGNPLGGSWNVKWSQAKQILFHYYTNVHLLDANDNNERLSPEYRWNPLDVSWLEDGCPSVIPAGGTCTATFHIQNTGTTTWDENRIAFSYHSWERQGGDQEIEQSRIEITETITPGNDIHIPFVVIPPDYTQSGEQYQLRFDMWYWDENDNNWVSFSDAETGRSWPTYDVDVCVGNCATIYLPLIAKNYSAMYFFESFNPQNDNWIFYTIPTGGHIDSYVSITTTGRTDNASLYIGEKHPYGGGSKIIIPVPIDETVELSFWHKRQTPGIESRFNVKINDSIVINDRSSGDSWQKITIAINQEDTTNGQIRLAFEIYNTQILQYKVLFDDIVIRKP